MVVVFNCWTSSSKLFFVINCIYEAQNSLLLNILFHGKYFLDLENKHTMVFISTVVVINWCKYFINIWDFEWGKNKRLCVRQP